MVLQRERVPAGAAALLAVVLAVPSVLAPTWQLTTLDSQRGVVLFDQQFWSWGRSQVLGAGGAVVQDLWDPLGLVVLIVLLAVAAATVVAWLLLQAAWVPVAAAVGWAALLGHLLTSAAQRHGRPVRDDVHGLAASGSSTVVGWLESASAGVGVVAVALLVLSLAGVRMPSAWLARARALAAPEDEDGTASPGSPTADPAGRVRPTIRWRPASDYSEQGTTPEGAGEPAAAEGAGESETAARAQLLVRATIATIGGLGVLLAATTAIWPTTVLAVRAPEVGDFTKGYEQRTWSWGRQVVYSSDGVLLDAYGGPNPVPRLVLLVAALACASLGLGWWVARPGRPAQLVAAVGTALALATVAASLVERLSFDERSIGLQPGLVHITTLTGWLELAAVCALALTLALMVVAALPDPADALARRLSAVWARFVRSRRPAGVVTTGPGGVPEGPSTQRVASVRDASSPGTTHTTSVGFSDDDEPDRGRG
ncbi:hypothetical protein GCM10009740_00600 [Terrabacter terrae]|uniref:Uncharacterized protein n=1 Tax=Terrabacter terrae TaxID=318434 RepID=A0ABP5F4U1_9MICO